MTQEAHLLGNDILKGSPRRPHVQEYCTMKIGDGESAIRWSVDSAPKIGPIQFVYDAHFRWKEIL